MKPANLRKRGGNSRSVQTLADKVVNTILLAPALQRACFLRKKSARVYGSVVEKIFQEEQKHANGLYQ